jgi:predicted nucleic acid-binding protein
MDKLKILIDTSVVSNLYAPEVPHLEAEALEFWGDVKAGKYEVYISSVLFQENEACPEPKRTKIREFIADIDYILIDAENSLEISKIENEIIKQGILTENHRNDCTHIACAVVAGCDVIVSWNFKHMVKRKTINGIRAINLLNGFKLIDILPPPAL